MSSLKVRFIVVFGLFVLLSCTVISVFSAFAIRRTSSDLASRQGYPILEKAASVIDGDKFAEFCKHPSEDDPFYEETRLALLEIAQAVGCQYLYTMEPVVNGKIARYIIDGSCDPSDTENFSPLGTEEDITSYGSAPWDVMENGGVLCSGLENQEGWGWAVSSYRAIKTSSGVPVGFVGVDFDMSDFVAEMQLQILIISIVGISFVILGIAILTLFTSSIFGKMDTVSKAMENISQGEADLTSRIPEGGGKELSALAANCNRVIGSLNAMVRELQDEVSEKIKNIAEQSENLTEANEAIAAIAEQTDLLAMNAAIEAAHAGDAGKGFAVVADEIRQLAETSSTQSDEIKKLLGGISNAIMEIVTSSQRSAASFETVGTKILQLDGLIKEVRDGMQEQNDGVASISSTMQTLDSTTAEITMSSAHIKEAAKKLSAGAQDLEKMAVETKEKSEEAKQNMSKMRESVHAVVQATGLSNETSKKVSDMINRFKV